MKHNILLKFVIVLLLTACSSSNKISNSWKNPEATSESVKFQTVAVFAMVKDQQMQKDIEEMIASQMPNTVAIPAYNLVTNEDLADINVVKQKLKERAIEGALVLSVRSVDQKTTYYSSGMYPSSYYNFGGYYNYAWNYMYDPYMYSSTNVYVDIEILIYSLKDDKLVWYGESTSINPESVEQTISELAVSVKKQLVEDGLFDQSK